MLPSCPASDDAAEIVRPGTNCWRLAHADRVAVLVDGQAYFAAFAAAAQAARASITILGWDFHGAVRLHPDQPVGQEDEIGRFLENLVAQRPALRVHVLDWNFSVIYAFERQMFPRWRWRLWSHPSFRFHLDGAHPAGAAQHQKIVVIDDAVAFVGGFDFGLARWDSSDHAPADARRVGPDGHAYGPFHDAMMAVDGAAARALGQLTRDRWQRATGERPAPVVPVADAVDVWPIGLEPDFVDVDVAISRTHPAFDGQPEIREVERLYVDAIAAAKHTLYFENQYLTSAAVEAALAARLQEPDGPEVVILQPRQCQGWLEQTTMGVLRARLMRRLVRADRFGRLRVYYPDVAGLGDQRLNVHAKVLAVDDRLLRVGSANLNNRSMGVDSECDLAIDAGDDAECRRRVAAVRNRLVGEHVGHAATEVAAAIETRGSLSAAIEQLSSPARGLRRLDWEVDASLDAKVPDADWVDPSRPLGAEPIAARARAGRWYRRLWPLRGQWPDRLALAVRLGADALPRGQ